ncbi:DMT family transporter [Candidatus Pacearchaeota archaeon]|nr:DMT family transporter [Candidatus Pacearchaeota archaeon]
MVYLPILGGLAMGIGIILEKFTLRSKKIDYILFNVVHFLFIALVMAPIAYFFWHFDAGALQPKNIFLFFVVLGFNILANTFIFYSFKKRDVTFLEPARAIEPLFTIILAFIFSFIFGTALYERNTNIFIPALVAGAFLIFPHIKKGHLKFNKYFLIALLGSLFFAFELIFSRLILEFYNPVTFYFLRCSFSFLVGAIIFRPDLIKIKKFKLKYIFAFIGIGISWSIFRIIVYYGYLELGVMFTTLIIMLGPLFIYFFAHFFLGEKMNWKSVLSSIVVILCILYVVVL